MRNCRMRRRLNEKRFWKTLKGFINLSRDSLERTKTSHTCRPTNQEQILTRTTTPGPSTLGNSEQTDLTWLTQSTRHAQNNRHSPMSNCIHAPIQERRSIRAPARRATCIQAPERGATRIHPHSVEKLVPVQTTLETSRFFYFSSRSRSWKLD
jgi:hypothetical protein